MYGIFIEFDTDFDPSTAVDWSPEDTAEYVAKFDRGELIAYGISVVKLDENGNVPCQFYRQSGTWGPDRIISLWGCESESAADGLYDTLISIPDECLRQIATDLLSEQGVSETVAPELWKGMDK